MPGAASADYGRGMAFATDYSRLYVAWRSPSSLQILDVVPDATGVPNNRLVDSIALGKKPSEIVVAPTGPGGRDLVYISLFGEDAVWVVDPALRAVVATIPMRLAVQEPGQDARIVRGSPFALSAVHVPSRGWQLYAALFSVPPGGDHQIVVIPIGEGAANRNVADHIVHVGGTP